MTYQEAQTRIDDERLRDEVTVGLRQMNALAKVLRKRRADRCVQHVWALPWLLCQRLPSVLADCLAVSSHPGRYFGNHWIVIFSPAQRASPQDAGDCLLTQQHAVCAGRGALQLASPEVRFEIDRETHDPLDVGMYQVS